jgi:sugar/nucleoside kinase (ribokinase family)
MHDYDILVVGDLNVDLVLGGDDLAPRFGQVEKLAEDAVLAPGGSSAIFACGASRLGSTVAFAGKVGDDLFGRFLLDALRERGVDTSAVIVDARVKTGLTVHLTQPGDRAMLTYPGSVAALRATEIDRRLLAHARHLHIGSVFLQAGLRPGLSDLLAWARAAGATVSLDPGWDPMQRWDGALLDALRQVSIFLPNEQEAIRIAGCGDLDSALSALAQRVPTVAIKLGAQGAVARRAEEQVRSPGFLVGVVDTIGAGDSFDAGFVCALLQGRALATSLRWGCACGALATTAAGGVAGQPTADVVARLLQAAARG